MNTEQLISGGGSRKMVHRGSNTREVYVYGRGTYNVTGTESLGCRL